MRGRTARAALLSTALLLVTVPNDSAGAQPPTSAPDPTYDPTAAPEVLPLWPGRAPGAAGDADADRPTLTLYRPFGRKPTDPPGAAVIVAPGGGYGFLAANHEGRQVANFLNSLGVTAFVLRYRVAPRYRHPVPLGDARRALRLVRARARDLGVRPDQVGLLGFSAGGHLAATAATRFDAAGRATPTRSSARGAAPTSSSSPTRSCRSPSRTRTAARRRTC